MEAPTPAEPDAPAPPPALGSKSATSGARRKKAKRALNASGLLAAVGPVDGASSERQTGRGDVDTDDAAGLDDPLEVPALDDAAADGPRLVDEPIEVPAIGAVEDSHAEDRSGRAGSEDISADGATGATLA